MNKAGHYRPALLSLGDVDAVDFGFGVKQESFGFMLYKITRITIKSPKFYIKFGYFASCFAEVCES